MSEKIQLFLNEAEKRLVNILDKGKKEELTKLFIKSKAENFEELFLNAIALLDWSIDELLKGKDSIASIDEDDGRQKKVKIPLFKKLKNS